MHDLIFDLVISYRATSSVHTCII